METALYKNKCIIIIIIMFVFNKTGTFMDELTPEQREKLINKVLGKGTAELRRSMKEREKARHEILLKKQLEKTPENPNSRRKHSEKKRGTDCDNS